MSLFHLNQFNLIFLFFLFASGPTMLWESSILVRQFSQFSPNLPIHLNKFYALLNLSAIQYCCYDDSFSFSLHLKCAFIGRRIFVFYYLTVGVWNAQIHMNSPYTKYYWRPYMMIRKKITFEDKMSTFTYWNCCWVLSIFHLLPSAVLKVDSEKKSELLPRRFTVNDSFWIVFHPPHRN